MITQNDLKIKTTQGAYFRCPTCLNWSAQPAIVAPWELNNPKPLQLCQRCFDAFASANNTEQMLINLNSYAPREAK